MTELTHIALFAGIGGDSLAAQWAGFKQVLFVEIDGYCQKILKKHWPDVPIIGDIKDVTEEVIANARSGTIRAGSKRIRRQNGTDIARRCEGSRMGREGEASGTSITLITGGFPCQPVSVAGKRRGKEDDRWLWPEMLRVISIVRPTWVVAENVTGLLHLGFYDCLSDLEGEGYETSTYIIPACGVNAPHRRDRIFIVGYSEKLHQYASDYKRAEGKAQVPKSGDSGGKGDVAESSSTGFQDIQGSCKDTLLARGSTSCDGSWWNIEPPVGRVAHGIPSRVDRLKGLGNAIVPQQIYPILKGIADIEFSK